MEIRGARVFITGGSRGIGRAIAFEMARRGAAAIGITYKENKDKAINVVSVLKEGYNVDALAYKADVRKYKEIYNAVNDFIGRFGGIDIVVANAGILNPKEFIDTETVDIEDCVRTNLLGVLYLARATLPAMVETGKGVFVVISSVLGISPEPEASVYSATKAAVIAWARSVAKELADKGVRVFSIAPGGVDTDMAWSWGDPSEWVDEIPMKRLARPEEIAKIVADAVENDYVNGDIITISGALL